MSGVETLSVYRGVVRQVAELESRVEGYRQQVEQLESAGADWELEKTSLEDLVVKLREQVRRERDGTATNKPHRADEVFLPENII